MSSAPEGTSARESLRYPLSLQTIRQYDAMGMVAGVHVALVVMAIGVALIWRTPAATILGAPSLAILVAALLAGMPDDVEVQASLDRERALAGDAIELTVSPYATRQVPAVDIELEPERVFDPVGPTRSFLSVDAARPMAARMNLATTEWGVHPLGAFTVSASDAFQLFTTVTRYRITSTVRVHIREEATAALQDPSAYRRFVGSHVAPDRSEGFDFADVRAYQPGDRLRSLNWRISARREEPWVTLRHPDRSTSVVIVLDASQSFSRRQADVQRRAVQAVLGLARLHSNAQDRVGLLLLGSGMRWIEPNTGSLHLHQINDALLDLSKTKWATRAFNLEMMNRLVPADAFVIGVSPLGNRSVVQALTLLHQRGRRVDVIQPVVNWRKHRNAGDPDRFASRLYDLESDLERRRIRFAGLGVFPWEIDKPVDSALRSMQARRRLARAGVVA